MVSPRALALLLSSTLLFIVPGAAMAQSPGTDPSGGAAYLPPPPPTPAPDPAPAQITVPGTIAQLLPDGTAAAPADAPAPVQQAIWGANQIQGKPYVYGGGHASFVAKGYDCSGTVSYALHAAGLLKTPLDSSSFMRWGAAGPGQWITVYANPGHAFAVIAGLRLDTSAAGVARVNGPKAAERGPRWRPTLRSAAGYKRRHPVGF